MMYSMMRSFDSSGIGLSLFGGLHVLASLSFAIGVLFLVYWAFKSLSEKTLWKWGWILVAVGVLLSALLLVASVASYSGRGGFSDQYGRFYRASGSGSVSSGRWGGMMRSGFRGRTLSGSDLDGVAPDRLPQ